MMACYQGFKLVTEKSLDLPKLHGEQDPKNRVSYMKWARKYQQSDRGGRALPLTRICEGRRQWTGRTEWAE